MRKKLDNKRLFIFQCEQIFIKESQLYLASKSLFIRVKKELCQKYLKLYYEKKAW